MPYKTLLCLTRSYCTSQQPTVPYNTLMYYTIPYCALQDPTVPYNTLLYITILYFTLQYSTVPYSTLLCLTKPYSDFQSQCKFTLQYNNLLSDAIVYSNMLYSVPVLHINNQINYLQFYFIFLIFKCRTYITCKCVFIDREVHSNVCFRVS